MTARLIRRTLAYLHVVYTAARLRPLVIGVAVTGADRVQAVTGDDQPIMLAHWAMVDNCTIRSKMHIAGDGVVVTNNVIDLRKEE